MSVGDVHAAPTPPHIGMKSRLPVVTDTFVRNKYQCACGGHVGGRGSMVAGGIPSQYVLNFHYLIRELYWAGPDSIYYFLC